MDRERADELAGEGSIPHSRGDGRANIWTRGMTKSIPLRVERPTQKRLSRMRRKRRFAIMETGMESLP